MAHVAGTHAQFICKTRFTHFLCTGYRFESVSTLRRIGLDPPLFEGKVEIFCSCSCHNHVQMLLEEPQRFEDADRATSEIFNT